MCLLKEVVDPVSCSIVNTPFGLKLSPNVDRGTELAVDGGWDEAVLPPDVPPPPPANGAPIGCPTDPYPTEAPMLKEEMDPVVDPPPAPAGAETMPAPIDRWCTEGDGCTLTVP